MVYNLISDYEYSGGPGVLTEMEYGVAIIMLSEEHGLVIVSIHI